jgi:hypothetical protein
MSIVGTEHLTAPNLELALRQSVTMPGQAHWAGTGPAGKHCFNCVLFRQRKKETGTDADIPREGRCRKFISINRARHGSAPILYIPPTTPSCVHFEPKP